MLNDIDVAGVYRLAAAVVKGLPADDPERERWIAVGHRIRERLAETPTRRMGAARPGHMSTSLVETNSRIATREARRKRTRISAR